MRQIIRKAELSDGQALSELAASSGFCANWTKADFESELNNKFSLVLVSEGESSIAGFISFRFCFETGELTNFAVSPDFYRRGIGTRLLAEGLRLAAENSVEEITLEVSERNIAAVALYEKFLFKTVNIRKKFYNNTDNALLMLRKL